MDGKSSENGSILPEVWRGQIMDSLSEIGATIRAERKRAGLTQEDLAHLAQTSERTIRAIETATGNPSLHAVVAAANVLGMRLVAMP